MTTTIDLARPADFLAIAALDRMAWPARPDTFIPDGEHIWRVWCEHATVFVARHEGPPLPETGTIAGALVMFPTRSGELFLHKIMVHPDCRGRGLGSALMREALAKSTVAVLLTVDPANAPAVQLYRNFGYRIRDDVKGYYRPHEDRYVMVYDPACASRPG